MRVPNRASLARARMLEKFNQRSVYAIPQSSIDTGNDDLKPEAIATASTRTAPSALAIKMAPNWRGYASPIDHCIELRICLGAFNCVATQYTSSLYFRSLGHKKIALHITCIVDFEENASASFSLQPLAMKLSPPADASKRGTAVPIDMPPLMSQLNVRRINRTTNAQMIVLRNHSAPESLFASCPLLTIEHIARVACLPHLERTSSHIFNIIHRE